MAHGRGQGLPYGNSSRLVPWERSHYSPRHFHSPQCSVVFSWRSEGPGFQRPICYLATEGALLFRQKDPKPFPPRSALFHRADAGNGRAAQLAGLRQGRVGRSAGGVINRAGGRSTKKTVDWSAVGQMSEAEGGLCDYRTRPQTPRPQSRRPGRSEPGG